jgi:hypothetical protein
MINLICRNKCFSKKKFKTYPILWNIFMPTNVFLFKQNIFSQSMRSNINHLCLRKIMLIKFFFYFEFPFHVCTMPTNVFLFKQNIFSQSMRSNINYLCLRNIMLIKFFFYFEFPFHVCMMVKISIKTRYGRTNQS